MLEPERELTLEAARQRICEQLELLSLRAEVTWRGAELGVAQVRLYSGSHQTSQGWGKGYRAQALVGAHYEALEHHLDRHLPRRQHLRLTDTLAANTALHDDLLMPWLQAQPGRALACQAYHDLQRHWLFDYPTGLTHPNYADAPLPGDTFDHRALRRYSSNDGSAIGATRDEAVLHALNQTLERDATSLFLLRHFYHQHQDTVTWLDKPSAGTPLGQLWRHAEQTLQAPIHVLDISTEFASRTYLALRMDVLDKPHGSLFGAGTSLDPWHAAHRAVSELVQVQLNAQDDAARKVLAHQERLLHPFPKLLRCLQLDLMSLIECPQASADLSAPETGKSVRDQLERLTTDLHAHGYMPGVCEVFSGREGLSLVNVIVPGLERFHLVTNGNVVCPGPRGVRLTRRVEA
ncbi:YcaO-like family protein [Pseudomonas entomophila]|uniref:YcaO-like family protein n=1 Tax=Pseudomonas entomophila TaxID=312306 RepID=UPI0023D7C324|nr:YcaO-like family protein [Pseudomonas entomophila]MDF0733674.1 YcaO-like family protein [Pseudomonas entomophila]